MRTQDVLAAVIAVIVIGFIGAYAMVYPGTAGGELALGALLPIAGGVGTYFFHASSQGFLGTQLQAQRAAFVATMATATGDAGYGSPTSPSTSSPNSPPAATSPTTTRSADERPSFPGPRV